MAIKKQIELPTGVTGDHWKIEKITLEANITHVDVALYKDKKAKNDGKQKMQLLSFVWAGDNNPCTEEALKLKSPWELCYNELLLNPLFENGTKE